MTYFALVGNTHALDGDLAKKLEKHTSDVEKQVIAWRRDVHQNPELGNREFRTAKLVAEHLISLGMEVKTGIAHTGVVGFLKGGKPGPLVALRADMDALPVTEKVDLPFASKAKTMYRGQEVGVMHACGHDSHVAILMGVAKIMAEMKDGLAGDVMFIFQPAEEGAPEGEEGGAELMVKEGIFKDRKPDAIFGLHVSSGIPAGVIGYRAGPAMAASDSFRITVRGRQTHVARPWNGVDPIVVTSQIVMGLQTIVSRQTDITAVPSIVSVGSMHAGVRSNIIPDSAELWGTIRTYDDDIQKSIHDRIRQTATSIAESAGATADVEISIGYPVTHNNEALTAQMLPTLQNVAGEGRLIELPLITGAEDFSFFQREVPGLFIFLGVTPPDQDISKAASNHSPYFFIDESALP
ncbi:MAG: amidohydrolase, partial [Pseudomonadota bacterium]